MSVTQIRPITPLATERLAQKPSSFGVMKEARLARSMYQRQLLQQFMTFLLSYLPSARRDSLPGRTELRGAEASARN